MALPPRIDVSVWSDLACPWCYVGKRRLDKAISKLSDKARIETKWHPYMIDPATNPQGEEYLAYNERRWGSDGWTHQLRQSGRPDGAVFSDWRWWPNTLKAHQLINLAEQEGKDVSQAEELLFRAIYEEGKNVSDMDTLGQIGIELGLKDVQVSLNSQALEGQVRAADRDAKQRLNIHSVPHFCVTRSTKSFVLSGAQSTSAFERVFMQSLQD